MPHQFIKYSSSGKYDSIAFAYAAGALVLIIPLLAYLYAQQAYFLPNIINIAVWAGTCYLLAKIIERLFRAGKVRSSKFSFWMTLILISVFSYLQWAVWTDTALSNGLGSYSTTEEYLKGEGFWGSFHLASKPKLLWAYIKEINFYGAWRVDGERISGFFVWVFWFIEGIGFLFIVLYRWAYSHSHPFSEEDNNWNEEVKSGPLNHLTTDHVLKAIRTNDHQFFSQLERIEKGNEEYSELILFSSEKGPDFLSLIQYKAKVDRGRVVYDSKKPLELYELDKKSARAIATVLNSEPDSSNSSEHSQDASLEKKKILEIKETDSIKPVIGFKYNKTFELGSVLYMLLFTCFGGFLLYVSTLDYMEDKLLTGIGGFIFTTLGIIFIIRFIFSKGVSKNKIVLKINPTYIEFDTAITGESNNLIIPFSELKGVEQHANESGTVELTFLFKDKTMFGTDLLNVGVSSVDVNSIVLSKELQKFIGQDPVQRQKTTEDWARRKPSLMI